jgi:hypothetical protein
MMEICPVAGADSQVQVDAVFENMANVIRQAASASIGTKISRGRSTAAWWTLSTPPCDSSPKKRTM